MSKRNIIAAAKALGVMAAFALFMWLLVWLTLITHGAAFGVFLITVVVVIVFWLLFSIFNGNF